MVQIKLFLGDRLHKRYLKQDRTYFTMSEVDVTTKDIPNWVTIDYADIWENFQEDYKLIVI